MMIQPQVNFCYFYVEITQTLLGFTTCNRPRVW